MRSGTVYIILMLYLNLSVARTSAYMSGYVVNGLDVPITMYPHVARLEYYGLLFCGGSIIRPRVVLTAAHCLTRFNNNEMDINGFQIVVGATRQYEGNAYDVCQMAPHPKFGGLNYDVGLVSVRKSFKFGVSVKMATIVTNEKWRNSKYTFTMAGFGATNEEFVNPSPNLQAIRLRYIDSDICERTQTSFKHLMLPIHSVCLIGDKWSGDCYGDSGSGILWKRYLIGVVSAGRDQVCGSDMIPSMYTNLYYFRKWIASTINKLETSKKCGHAL